MKAALQKAAYPDKSDTSKLNVPMLLLLLTILVVYVAMVYGPIAAWLVELFPTRIRYTSMSLPYHIGNGWFGGFLPTTAFALVATTGNIYQGLWYPIVVAAVTVVGGDRCFLPETRRRYFEVEKRAAHARSEHTGSPGDLRAVRALQLGTRYR